MGTVVGITTGCPGIMPGMLVMTGWTMGGGGAGLDVFPSHSSVQENKGSVH